MKPRFYYTLILSISIVCIALPVFAQQELVIETTLNVGFGPNSFKGVNLTDAKAAFKVFTQSAGKKRGYKLSVNVQTFDDAETFVAAVQSGPLHLVIMTAWTYLSSGLEAYLEPRFIAIDSRYGPQEYLTIVHTDSPIQDIEALRRKNILLLENTNCEMSQRWFQTLLLERGVSKPEVFLGRLEVVGKASGAVLPVFFNQADACVVNRGTFDTMRELNPQLGKRLRSIAVSAPLADSVTFLSYAGWDSPQQRLDMIESLAGLHKTEEGKQILTLFKVDRMAPFESAFLAGTLALKDKYDRLHKGETSP